MTTTDIFHETYSALSANKARSGLTILGIVIGIASVIAMISIGQGAQGSIQSSIQSIGSNLIMVMPGAQKGPGYQVSSGRGGARTLITEDATAIMNQIQNVAAVSPQLSGRYQITAKGTNTNTSVNGVTSAYPQVRDVQIAEGSFITDTQNQSLAKVAVLGPTTVSDLFATGTDPVGQTISIKGLLFTVIGVTVAKGGSGFNNQDDMIFVPLSSAQRYFAGADYLSEIDVQAADQNSMTQVQNDITSLLLTRHNISDPTQADFSTLNQADIVAAASSVTSTFTILLAAVAGISLVVGGIGIMNMMLTTVTERTREIGLRKAIGAKKKDISTQFLAESVMLTLIGGIIGTVLGIAIAYTISSFGSIHTQITWQPIALAFGVSAIIGIIFGYYPARRAASLNPIQALRYE
ncbi:MAG: ABC transporter permease [Patescibacteria group bacterium]|nr:ABC transporter permease [Patescibacteria group bacterium]